VALEQAGQIGKIKFIAYDAFTPQVKALRAGKIQGLIAQQPYEEGRLGVERAVKVLNGEPVPPKTILPNVLVTQENVDQPEISKVVYKSHC
jgi:ribose transport system substrate-binding protein